MQYPANLWKALLDASVSSAAVGAAGGSPPLSPSDRATLLDDYLTISESTQFAAAGVSMTALGLDRLAALLAVERAYEPLIVALSHLNLVASLLIPDIPLSSAAAPFSATPFTNDAFSQGCYANFTAFGARALAPALSYLTWSPIAAETPLLTQLRASLLATAGALGDAGTIATARAFWANFTQKGTPIPVDLAALVACNVVRWGGGVEYSAVQQLYLTATDAASKRRYLSALSCSRDRALLDSLLNLMQDTSASPNIIGVGDKAGVVAGVAGNAWGRSLAWARLAPSGAPGTAAWAQLMAWFPGGGGFDVSSLVSSLVGNFLTQEYATRATEVFGPGGSARGTMSGAARDFAAAVESVGRGVLWGAAEKAPLCAWLAAQQ